MRIPFILLMKNLYALSDNQIKNSLEIILLKMIKSLSGIAGVLQRLAFLHRVPLNSFYCKGLLRAKKVKTH